MAKLPSKCGIYKSKKIALGWSPVDVFNTFLRLLRPCLHGVGDPGLVGRFLLFCVPHSVKTKETNPTRPGSPTPCKQALRLLLDLKVIVQIANFVGELAILGRVQVLLCNLPSFG